jgi:hypothetical protein
LDRVIGAWINNILRFKSEATYVAPPSGSTPATPHVLTAFFASNATFGATNPGKFTNFVSLATMPPGSPPNFSTATPNKLDLPILDTSAPFTQEGLGGNTASGTDLIQGGQPAATFTNLPSRLHNLPIGMDTQVQMSDSPAQGALPNHPVLPGVLTSYEMEIDFRCDLCFWTNMRGLPGAPAAPGPDLANLLYVTVQTVFWNQICHVTFDPATGAPTITVKPNTTLTKEADQRLAKRVEGSGLEVSFPIGLRNMGRDATK